MKNNLILRKIAQALILDNHRVGSVFKSVGIDLSDNEIADLLSGETASHSEQLPDSALVLFLNGLIDSFRGKRDGINPEPVAKATKISNNDVLKKLRIALNFQEQDLREALELVTIELTKSDLSALFRKPGHAQYKSCDDELLMDFFEGFGRLLQQRKGEAA